MLSPKLQRSFLANNKLGKNDIVVFAIGVAFIFLGIFKLYVFSLQQSAHDKFTPVPAHVISVSIKHILNLPSAHSRSEWVPEITYGYDVDTKPYISSLYSYDQFYSEQEATEISNQYHAGDTITAYYDPDAPDMAIIHNDISSVGTTKAHFAIGLGILLIAVRSMMIYRRPKQIE